MSLSSALLSFSASLPRAKLQRISILNHSKCAFHLGAPKKPSQGTDPILPLAGLEGKLSLLMDQLSAPRILPLRVGPLGILSRSILFSCSMFLHPLAWGELAGWDMAPSQTSALSKKPGAECLVASTLLRFSASGVPGLGSLGLGNSGNGIPVDRQELTELFPLTDLHSLAQGERFFQLLVELAPLLPDISAVPR